MYTAAMGDGKWRESQEGGGYKTMPYKSACGKYFSCRNTITKATEYVTFGFFFQYFGFLFLPGKFERHCL